MFTRLTGVALVCCGLLAATVSCAAETQLSTQESELPATREQATPGFATDLQSVMTIASVDVDGLHVTATGYVAGVIEGGGTCEYHFANVANDQKLTASSTGVPERSTTMCPSVAEPIGLFAKGTWLVSLRYATVAGDFIESEPLTLEIP